MRRRQLIMFGTAMLGLGYVAGASGWSLLARAGAQDKTAGAADDRIKAAHLAVADAADALKAESNYEVVTEGQNAFLILSGGGNARQDLESGLGVDPETFAGLYAGRAIPEIQDQLTLDDQNRLTFNGKVIQMYSKSTLQKRFANRLRLSGAK